MKKSTLLACAMYLGAMTAGAQTSCDDVNGYPQSKNTGGTGAYTLITGFEENAAQTYHYSGPGTITGVRVYGSTPNTLTGVHLMVRVYNVDVTGRPTGSVASKSTLWSWGDNFTGFKDVSFSGGGYALSSNFAVSVEIQEGITSVTKFQVTYNGNGEGKGEDLASLAGTSTGFNWASAKNTFSKDGDFYIVPKMKNYVTSAFTPATVCASTSSPIAFTNNSTMTTDSMFNRIALAHYAGTNYFYTWDFGDGSPVCTVKSPAHTYTATGVYTVSLTSTIDEWTSTCSNTTKTLISVGLSTGTPSVTNVSCNGSENGSFTVTATGGGIPYSYSINGDTYVPSSTFSSFTAGLYTLHVKDMVGCDQTTSVMVTQPAAIVFASPTTTNASCSNTNGGIQLSATGGSGALQYSLNGSTWQNGGSFSNLAAGTYTVWAKDGNGCTNNVKVAVNSIGGPTLTIVSSTNVNCNGANNATIIASATGGSGLLQYSINGVNFQTSGTFNGLAADTFYVTVRDASGCLDIEPVIVSQPSKLNFTPSSTPVLCNGGFSGHLVINNVIGGTGNMSYSDNGVHYQSGSTFFGIPAGVYTTYVKDASGCVATRTVAVTEPPVISAVVQTISASCNFASNGDMNVVASGGTPGYTYSMDGENFFPTGDFSDLAAGTYTVIVKDNNGCTYSTSSLVTQPSAITSTVVIGNSTCGNADGNILITAGGGSGTGYQYSINGTVYNTTGSFPNLKDSTYIILVKDDAGCVNGFHAALVSSGGPVINTVSSTNVTCSSGNNGSINITSVTGGSGTLNYQVNGSPWQTSTSFTGLTAGPNTIIVKDGLGCSGSYQVILTAPSPISVNVATVNLLCSGLSTGSATITAGGGSGTMAYSTDGILYQSSNIFTNLGSGNYQVYVRDAGGCIGTNNFAISSPKEILIANTGVLDVTCHGAANGAISIVASGGTGSLQYSLDGTTYQASNNFSGLNGGTYTIFVKDINGCTKTQTVLITEPAAIAVFASVSNVSCAGGHNGSVILNISGGNGPFMYSWSNHAGSGSAIYNVGAGNYSVTVSDENGCTKTLATTVTQPTNPLIINATIVNATGSNANGSVNATVTGGTAPYSYSWSNSATTPNINGLLPGTYIVTITDANGCVTSGVYTVGTATGIENVASGSTQVKVYPNPATNLIILESDNAVIDQVEVINLIGEILYKDSPKAIKVNINLERLVEGMYLIRYSVNNSYITTRFEVMK
ncbi:MAG TPA: PKD domain-containing protein [Bacteroidia bacterium]